VKGRISEIEVERVAAFAAPRVRALLPASGSELEQLEDESLDTVYREIELPLARVLAGMEEAGVRIDVMRLAKTSRAYDERIAALEKEAHAAAGREFQITSPRVLEGLLFDELGLPVVKRTKTARSTDADVLEELAPLHPLPQKILDWRQLTKLKSTYVDALPAAIDPRTGRVHTRFNQAVAATGRLSSSEPNLQNIPIRTEEGRLIREAFIAADGYSILSADYSQIELRVLAHMSGDPELCDAFSADADVHVRTATALFDVSPEEVTKDQRAQAKTVNFAVIYGQSEMALARNLGIENKEAGRYIRAFFQRYSGVARYLDGVVAEARRTGAVRTMLGRKRAIPDLDSRNRSERWAAERVARNTPIQGTAADIIKRAMVDLEIALDARKSKSRMILTVHDELVLEVHESELAEMPGLVKGTMERAVSLKVPLLVETGVGRSWGEAH
jgi:DNA polymerase-1